MHSMFLKMAFPLCEYSLTNMHSLLSPAHYHIHLARCCPPPPHSVHPLTPRPSFVPRWAFISSSLCEWEAVLAAESNGGVKPGHTWTPTETVTADHVWTGFDLLDCTSSVCFLLFNTFLSASYAHTLTSMHTHNIHFYSLFLSELGSHTEKQFRKWFLLVVKL